MGEGGITVGGDVVQSPANDGNPANEIEIPFSDPNFLPRAVTKSPTSAMERARQLLGRLADGLYSWPFDYTLGIHFLVGLTGFYGADVKATCVHHRDRLLSVISAAARVSYYMIFRGILWKVFNNETARNLASETLNSDEVRALTERLYQNLPEWDGDGATVQFLGRFASGSFFQRWMQSRVRGAKLGKLEGAAGKTIKWGNLLILSCGAAVHSSIKHPGSFGVIEIFVSIINGDAEFEISSEMYTDIYRIAQTLEQNSELVGALGPDYDLFKEFIQELTGLFDRGSM